ncbi:MAG: hypothetical protein PHR81_11190 [Bacteroidales bacterium]|jgi:hypothetical protein|nr:hypothetical protein [Bacteroidales bacterium]MDD4215366.1 hypothetical protein [Bacteroidales bacterium]
MGKRNFFTGFSIYAMCILLFFCLDSNGVFAQRTNVDAAYLISDGRVGNVEINMDAGMLKKYFTENQVEEKKVNGKNYSIIKVNDDNKKTLMEMETLCADICMISRILVYSSLYKTAEGVCVGKSFSDIKKSYSMKGIYGDDNNTYLVYVKEFKDAAFVLKGTDASVKTGKPYESFEIKDTEPISSIIIF